MGGIENRELEKGLATAFVIEKHDMTAGYEAG